MHSLPADVPQGQAGTPVRDQMRRQDGKGHSPPARKSGGHQQRDQHAVLWRYQGGAVRQAQRQVQICGQVVEQSAEHEDRRGGGDARTAASVV